ncbi:MAG TPA: hypothetical protein VIP11_21580 [Gemmatimonadaceae bacterium]
MRSAIVVTIACSALATRVAAQKMLIGRTGVLYRYHGDTIWIERDTTVSRTIFRGDTVFRTMTVNGRTTLAMTYVALADSARLVDLRDSLGQSKSVAQVPSVPLRSVTFEREMLEMELRGQDLQARMGSYALGMEPPLVSESPRTYAVSDGVTITQFQDTIWFARGCPKAGRVDTTKFVLYRSDSLKRLTAPERMFGQAMAASIIGQMRSAMIRARAESFQSAAPKDLPRAPNPCAR